MRAFLGVRVPPPEPVLRFLDELAQCGADLKMIERENLHVTLRFLGDVPAAQADVFLQALRKEPFPSRFAVGLRDVGAFPDWKKMNVVWIGLDDIDGGLAKCFALQEQVFASLGVVGEERAFRPHLTVARKRSDRDKDRARSVAARYRSTVFGQVEAGPAQLFESTLTSSGPVYRAVGAVA
jgi:RNA 2',3'-cyclic 3'-phosphodiesterase